MLINLSNKATASLVDYKLIYPEFIKLVGASIGFMRDNPISN